MLNDITFDAFLANDRTLDDPEVVKARKADVSACASSMPALPATCGLIWAR
ncbi:MAG: hypothetical protein IPK59_23145 [Rhodospirillaceae bacterium]|nr:hypothetical protein [Rhodospirillaceae bacterium]